MKVKAMKAKDFEQQFDEYVDITSSLDLTKAKRPLQKQKTCECRFSYMGG